LGEPGESKQDRWAGGVELLKVVAMPMVTLVVGFVINSSLNARQTRENNVRVYAEMMGRREEADSGLRKDMFKSILDTFMRQDPGLKPGQRLDQQILNLELLSYNFHESLDLAPLFKHVRRQIPGEGGIEEQRRQRLEKVALEVNQRELTVLSEAGDVVRGDAELSKVNEAAAYLQFGEAYVAKKLDQGAKDSRPQEGVARLCLSMKGRGEEGIYRQFRLEVIGHDLQTREVQVRLYATRPLSVSDCERADLNLVDHREIDTTFWVSAFDFPMIDNTRLSHGERCAVTLTSLTADAVQLALAYFPSSRASLKDKPYYDEVMHELLRAQASPGRRDH